MLNRLKHMLLGDAQESARDRAAASKDSGILVNAYCTSAVVPKLTFPHRDLNRREMPSAELGQHLKGFEGYVLSRGSAQMTRTKYHVVRHVQRVRQQLSFTVDEEQLNAVSSWAVAANAIIFLPDGSIRDPNGRVLVSAAGDDPEAGAAVPYPAQAWQRKARTKVILEAKGVRVPDHLPPLVSEPEVNLRHPAEVSARAVSLLMVAVRAESVAEGKPIAGTELRKTFPPNLVKLTPKEAAFIDHEAPARTQVAQFAWRYEGVFLLEWALGLAPALPYPERICDVPKTVQALMSAASGDLAKRARLREPTLILDALDLHYRLHWYVRQKKVDGQELLPGLDAGVISERHHALNWLVRFEDRDWDDVDTPT
jgi:hypothetical protein